MKVKILKGIKYKDAMGKLWTFTVKVNIVHGLTFIILDEDSEGFKFVAEKTGNEYYAHLTGESMARKEEVKKLVRKKLDEITKNERKGKK